MKTFYEMIRLLSENDELDSMGKEGAMTPKNPAPEPEEGGLASQNPAPQTGEKKMKNYMFFSNLKMIKNNVEQILAMDPKEIDAMLDDGHGWAVDHIATSKDDIEEVYGWLVGRNS
ncbi:hypothetical protein EBT16_01060 [bacterium]|nr:hypothetical protein [bacterium]